MKILIACESSAAVRDAFIEQGHDAMSCDLLDSVNDGPHYTGDVMDIIYEPWDLLIAHPPCTYLSSSGLHWNHRRPERAVQTEKAIEFARFFIDECKHIPLRGVENPIGCLSTKVRKPDQIIQPHQFGADASKATCLWLVGLPKLKATAHVAPRLVCCGKTVLNGDKYGCANCCGEKIARPRWANQTDSGQNKLAPSPYRWRERSKTYPGIALAMAQQWGTL
jgi:hypothetical protein